MHAGGQECVGLLSLLALQLEHVSNSEGEHCLLAAVVPRTQQNIQTLT